MDRVKVWRDTEIISRCFEEDHKKMYQQVQRTCKTCRAIKPINLLPSCLLELAMITKGTSGKFHASLVSFIRSLGGIAYTY